MTDQPHVEFFAFKARMYCLWFEKASKTDTYDAIQAVHVVSGLIASAAKLMRVPAAGQPAELGRDQPSRPTPTPTEEQFPVHCREDLAEVCAARDRTGGLPGCLAEVHRELVRGLDLLDAGRPYDAISHWQLGFIHNWGELAICGLMMLHSDLAEARSS